MKLTRLIFFVTLAWSAQASAGTGTPGILSSKHNLSSWGPGDVKALTESRVCVFCHTPHNATPQTPLWNRNILTGTTYTLYTSSTLTVKLSQPTGPSRLCLSCHDGTIGLGDVLSVPGGITMTKELTGRSTLLGTDLRSDHPFSFSYNDALISDTQINPTPPSNLLLVEPGNMVHCTTCHDPHDNSNGQFLAISNRNSKLCTSCHNITGWALSTHATSSATWNGANPALNPWPWNTKVDVTNQQNTVAENGCNNCHVDHNAGGPQRLMRYLKEEDNCLLNCHNGQVGTTNIAADFQKTSHHKVEMATIGDASGHAHDPKEDPTKIVGHVECQDCHNPHSVNNSVTAQAPFVQSREMNVSGVDPTGAGVTSVQFEYEICFKCHGDNDVGTTTIKRVINNINKRLAFDPSNPLLTPSFHPIEAAGRNSNVPSIPSRFITTLSVTSIIYCTDCHDSDQSTKIGGPGPNGPHGSLYPPILRQQYSLTGGVPESLTTYALCYQCHDRDNLLTDASFKKRTASGLGGHSHHLADGGGTSCTACHDPHGIYDNQHVTGDHTHLINFDTSVVTPAPGQTYPFFTDKGTFSGSCTLVCHGVTHDGSAQYTYP